MSNLPLHWKTCDKDIVKYFRSISSDKTIGEGRFLTDLFYLGKRKIYYKDIESHYESVYLNGRLVKLVHDDIINRTKYDKNGGVCRTYKLNDHITLTSFIYFYNNGISLLSKELGPVDYSKYTDPKLHGVIGMLSDDASLDLIKQSLVSLHIECEKLIAESKGTPEALYRKAKIASDLRQYTKILSRCEETNTSFIAKRRLKVGYTGRLYEIDGGLQGISKEAKKIQWDRPNFYNYDIAFSALSALVMYCDRLNIKCDFIRNYITQPEAPQEYANWIGISKKTFKQSIIILLFNGKIDTNGSIYELILHDFTRSAPIDQCWDNFLIISKPFVEVINVWLNSLTKYSLSITRYGYVKNDVGCQLSVDDSRILKPGKMSAFFLQGLEASFIFDIILASKNPTHGFVNHSYEFDGLITEGRIPQSVIESAQNSSKFYNANLIIKPF